MWSVKSIKIVTVHNTPITIFICLPVTSSTVTLNLKLWDVLNKWKNKFGEPGWRCLWLKEYAMPLHTTHSLEKYRTEYLKILSLFLYQDSFSTAIMKKLGHLAMVIFSELWYTWVKFDLLLAEHWAKEGGGKRSNPSSLSQSVRRRVPTEWPPRSVSDCSRA